MKKTLLLFLIVMINLVSVKAQLTESFDGPTFPPVGWTGALISAGDGSGSGIDGNLWKRITTGVNPAASPHSGAGMAHYNSYDFDPTSQADLITPALNLTGLPKKVSFWVYRSATYSNKDSITLYINTINSATGGTYLGKIIRNINFAPIENSIGWYQYFFDISGSYNGATNFIIFRGTSQFGLNMYIDDVVVEDQPACNIPNTLMLSNYNYGAGTATATWAPPTGSPTGYEWAINTTGTAPASGTTNVSTTTAITGITSNVVNYLYVRTNCGGSGFSTWASLCFAALPCASIISPANGAIDVPQSQTFSWNAVPGANAYDFYIGTSSGSESLLFSTPGTSTTISNYLLPSTTHYWFVVPKIGARAAINSCVSSSFTLQQEPTTPTNNTCLGAVTITNGNVAGNAVNGTTIGATLTIPSNICGGVFGSADDDVWFEFTTTSLPPSGTLTITPNVAGGINDIAVEVFQATSCTNLGTVFICADATGGLDAEVINLNTLSPNTHYYMRIYSWASNPADRGGFSIVASAGNTLPVRLATFAARRYNGVNILNWTTEQELNTSHFVIERSSDARNFLSIGQVAATGNSNTVRNYTFTDLRPARGNNYYRLRSVDKDNASKISATRRIRNEGIADVTIYPNPVNDKLTVAVNADKATDGQLTITDISGKIVYTRIVKLPQGNTILPIMLSNIATGSYVIKIHLKDDVIIKKFNKQ